MVESSSDEILESAEKLDVAFLVVGDPFGYCVATCDVGSVDVNT